ncbi:MAG: SRPBCC family protein [Sporomusa sp.]
MFTYKNEIEAMVTPDKIWSLYSNVSQWPAWDVTMEKVELQGEFQAGTKGTMYMKGIPPLSFELFDVKQNERFVVIAIMGDIKVNMGHFITKNGTVLKLTHTIEIDGGIEAQIQGIGNGISSSIPPSMEQLVSMAKGN